MYKRRKKQLQRLERDKKGLSSSVCYFCSFSKKRKKKIDAYRYGEIRRHTTGKDTRARNRDSNFEAVSLRHVAIQVGGALANSDVILKSCYLIGHFSMMSLVRLIISYFKFNLTPVRYLVKCSVIT